MAIEIDPLRWSVGLSLSFILIYIVLCGYRRQVPTLTHVVMVAMSCASAVAAVLLGVTTYAAPVEDLGVLRDQKPGILLGALAMAWASVVSAWTSVVSPLVVANGAR
ncbi:hypothetical protein [Pseudomonas sp. TE3610]